MRKEIHSPMHKTKLFSRCGCEYICMYMFDVIGNVAKCCRIIIRFLTYFFWFHYFEKETRTRIRTFQRQQHQHRQQQQKPFTTLNDDFSIKFSYWVHRMKCGSDAIKAMFNVGAWMEITKYFKRPKWRRIEPNK